jgi:nitroreductase/NAD-dependent dihydropyrimidine dehydrogenase PreA subunit
MEPTFDSTLCLQDGLCIRVCPVGRLALGADGRPQAQADPDCLDCGHCAAVCPAGAVSQGDGELKTMPPDWRLDADKVACLLEARRSIRAFRSEPLPQETIAAMINVAQYAPSGHNTQPLAWTVISAAPDLRRIANATATWMRQAIAARSPLATLFHMQKIVDDWDRGVDGICRGAPHLVIAHAPASVPNASHTAAIALTYLDIAGQPLGVGTCWAGFVLVAAGASRDVHTVLGLPEGQRCAGVVMAGRPAVSYRRIPRRNQPRIEWR